MHKLHWAIDTHLGTTVVTTENNNVMGCHVEF